MTLPELTLNIIMVPKHYIAIDGNITITPFRNTRIYKIKYNFLKIINSGGFILIQSFTNISLPTKCSNGAGY